MAGTVTVKIIGDASSLTRAFGDAESTAQGFESKMQGLSTRMLSIGSKLSLGITGPLALIGKATVSTASDLSQSMGAVESVFGDARGAIDEFADTAADAAGLSKREVNEMAAVLGASLKGMGFETAEAATKVVELEKRAADMAATFGGSTQDAIQAIASLMRGERDPIERYGVSIKAVDVNARIMALGLDTSTAASQKNAEAVAGLDLLMASTSDTAGQFAREQDSVAGATARASAQAENAQATLGEGLQPIIAKVTNFAAGMAEKFAGLSDTWQTTILVGAAVIAALGPLVTLIGAVTAAVTGLSRAFAFLAANPIVLIIAAIAALVAGLVVAYQHSESFRNIVDTVAGAVANAAGVVFDLGKKFVGLWLDYTPLGQVLQHIPEILGAASNAFGWVIDKVTSLAEWLGKLPKLIDRALGPLDELVGKAGKIVGGAIGGVGNAIGKIPGFDTGGVVPGPVGAPMLGLLHGGETVLATHKPGVGLPTRGLDLDPKELAREFARAVAPELSRYFRSGPNGFA